MAIKFSAELEEQFKENNKRIRMWATWKLKTEENGRETVWSRMSEHDKEFNKTWNRISEIAYDLPLEKLKTLLQEAEAL